MGRHLPLLSTLEPASLALPAAPGAASGDDGPWMQVGDLARAVGKTVRAIHHYEELGLLRPHARSKGRYRLYDEAALTRLRWIQKMHDLGFSLTQVQDIVRTWETASTAPHGMGEVERAFRGKLHETREQIRRLQSLEQELTASLSYLDSCKPCDAGSPAHECAACRRQPEPQPDLVAGVHGSSGRPDKASKRRSTQASPPR
jgi:MerR family copper efflux transcriptional regulator